MNEDLDKFAARLAKCLSEASVAHSQMSMTLYGSAAVAHVAVGQALVAISRAITKEFGPKKEGETL